MTGHWKRTLKCRTELRDVAWEDGFPVKVRFVLDEAKGKQIADREREFRPRKPE